MTRWSKSLPWLALLAVVAACGSKPGDLRRIKGTITGLTGTGLVLQLNGGHDLTVAANATAFDFTDNGTWMSEGANYAVSVAANSPITNPPQSCSVENPSGRVGADDVAGVAVTCFNTYQIGGMISGLDGTGLTLHLKLDDEDKEDLPVANGATSFVFVTRAASTASYTVTVTVQPKDKAQTCTVGTNPTGTVGTIDQGQDIVVTCSTKAHTVGGTVSGLATGNTAVLQNNGTDDLTVTANQDFEFSQPVANGAHYQVTVKMNPASPPQSCTVENGDGYMGLDNVTNVTVTCRDTNANLSNLVLSAGTLAPPFSTGTTVYSAEVLNADSSMTVTPTAEDAKATIRVNGNPVASGFPLSVALKAGLNPVAIIVTAEDGSTRTYTVTVNQEVDAGTWVEIGPGTFTMGSPTTEFGRDGNEVQHQVTLTRSFVMLSTEVTQVEFNERMGYNPSRFGSCSTCPVEKVNWHESAAYCNALSTAAEKANCYSCTGSGSSVSCTPSTAYATPYECPGYRLPTEAEWEYAARAGDGRATYNGNLTAIDCTDTTLPSIAWFCGNANNTTHTVMTAGTGGGKNALGLYDMLGNVWEWCHDWYGTYPTGAVTNPSGSTTGSNRVIRGGSWDGGAIHARAAYRGYSGLGVSYFNQGLRPARSLP